MHNSLVKKIVQRSEYQWGRLDKEAGKAACLKDTVKEFFRQGYYAAKILVQERRLSKINHITYKEQLIAYSRSSDYSVDQWLSKYFGEGTALSDAVIIEISASGTMSIWESDMVTNSYIQLLLPRLEVADYISLAAKTWHLFKQVIRQKTTHYARVEFFGMLIDHILQCYKTESIVFPFEGQYWEQVICMMGRDNGRTTYGILHALNISCSLNSRLQFHKELSPDFFVSQSIYTSSYLQEVFGWPKDASFTMQIKGKYPLNRLIRVRQRMEVMSPTYCKVVLVLGSYMLNEDIAALELLETYLPGAIYYYKPHPIRYSDEEFMMSIQKECESTIWNDSSGVVVDLVVSPLSSTVSLELFLSGQQNLLVHGLSNGFSPNPFEQFDISIRTEATTANASLWSIAGKKPVESLREEIRSHPLLDVDRLHSRCPKISTNRLE